MSDGTVWAWGYNIQGDLGRGFFGGNDNGDLPPAPVQNLSNVVQIATGMEGTASACFALKSDGTLWSWGSNGYGQLGNGTNTSQNLPVQVKNLTNVVQIDATDHTVCALRSDGTVWVWGEINFPNYATNTTPVQMPSVPNVAMIACEYQALYYLKTDGTVWGYGHPLGVTLNNATPKPIQIPGLSGIVQISVQNGSFGALDTAGTVWYMGSNGNGQSNNPNCPTGPGSNAVQLTPYPSFTGATRIAMGAGSVYALRPDGSVWGWGYDSEDELGDGSGGSAASAMPPVQAVNLANQTYIGKMSYRSLSAQAVMQNTTVNSTILTQPYASTVSAKLTGKAFGNRLLAMPLSFSVDGTAIGSARTAATGIATTYLTPAFGAGSHTVVASFLGDSLYKPFSRTFTLTITKADTTTTTNKAALFRGIAANLTAKLVRKTDNGTPAGEELLFKIDGTAIGSAVTDGTGTATLSYIADTTFSVGNHTLTAEFAGDSNHNGSASAGAAITISKNKTVLSQSSVSRYPGGKVTLTATLKRSVDKLLLSGKTITFSVNGTVVGTGVTNDSGVASYLYNIPSTMALGKYPLSVSFDEDDYNLASTYSGATLTLK